MFKKNDKVICIDTTLDFNYYLKPNTIYTILHVDKYDGLIYIGHRYRGYDSGRFISADIFIKYQNFNKKLEKVLED